jgi:hypothetical protein
MAFKDEPESGLAESRPPVGSRARPSTLNVALPSYETDLVLEMWGTCQRALIEKFGGFGTDLHKTEIVLAAIQVFGKMDQAAIIEAVTKIYESGKSESSKASKSLKEAATADRG